MATTTRVLLGDNVGTEIKTSVLIENGQLNAITGYSATLLTPTNSTFAIITIDVGGTENNNRVCILAQGMIGGGESIFWTGSINMQPTWVVTLTIYSTADATITFGIVTDD